MTDYLHDEQIYIITSRLTRLRVAVDVLRETYRTSASDKDKAAINTAQTKLEGVVLRTQKELEALLKKDRTPSSYLQPISSRSTVDG